MPLFNPRSVVAGYNLADPDEFAVAANVVAESLREMFGDNFVVHEDGQHYINTEILGALSQSTGLTSLTYAYDNPDAAVALAKISMTLRSIVEEASKS